MNALRRLFRPREWKMIDELRDTVLKQNAELELLRPIPGDTIRIIKAVMDMKPKRSIGVFLMERWAELELIESDYRFKRLQIEAMRALSVPKSQWAKLKDWWRSIVPDKLD